MISTIQDLQAETTDTEAAEHANPEATEHTGEHLTLAHAATIVSLAGRLVPLKAYAVLHASGQIVTRIPSKFRNALRRRQIPDGDDCERTALRGFFWTLSETDTARQLYTALTANAPEIAEFAELHTGRIISTMPGNAPRSAVYYLAAPGLILETPEAWMSPRGDTPSGFWLAENGETARLQNVRARVSDQGGLSTPLT